MANCNGTPTLWVPDTALNPLFNWTANDMIVCKAHTGPTDWSYEELGADENREWRAFIDATEGPDASPCEMCRCSG
jgi:hypothetical protein